MNARRNEMVASISCLLLASAVAVGQPDAGPVKKTVRAADGLKLVCEVRGRGETALVFLHGWCGDRATSVNTSISRSGASSTSPEAVRMGALVHGIPFAA